MPDPVKGFDALLRASHHCRHYSFNLADLASMGPRCALGLDMSGQGASRPCWPNPEVPCRGGGREEYTDAERAAYAEARDAATLRMFTAIAALPEAIPVGTASSLPCPNCSGTLHYARWHRGAAIHCETPNCCGARMSLAADGEWPVRREATDA